MNNPAWNRVKDLVEVYLSYEREMNKNWKPSVEIDSRDKQEDYSKTMEELNWKKEFAFKEFMAEKDLFNAYHYSKQIELLERITVALEKIASKEI